MISDEQLKLDGMLEDAYERGYLQAKYDYEAEPCEDTVSRQAVLEIVEENNNIMYDAAYRIGKDVKALSSVTPKQRTGKWIDDCPMMTDEGLVRRIRCSVCGDGRKDFYGVSKNYCPNCGTKMEGESE